MSNSFSELEREAIYKAIYSRRDVRTGFIKKAVPEDVLNRVLNAAHHAPSVGFSQPWNFIVIDDRQIKKKMKQAFLEAQQEELQAVDLERQELYKSLKLEGIEEAELNICVTCDRSTRRDNILGQSAQSNMDLFSTVCAVQNLWLSARAEGLGLGWVSIVQEQDVKDILSLPPHVDVVAYLCLGYVDEFYQEPELEIKGWQERKDLATVIKRNSWDG